MLPHKLNAKWTDPYEAQETQSELLDVVEHLISGKTEIGHICNLGYYSDSS